MKEIWLRANRRVLLFAMAPALGIGIVGAFLATAGNGAAEVVGWILLALAVVMVVVLVKQLGQARIAYGDREVFFNLRAGAPIAVPVEVLEAFFLGQGPANLPAAGGMPTESVNLVARLSQKAPEWAHVEVKPALGRWCEGYVTIRGMWCEPLTTDVIRRLNRRLREVREGEAPAEPGASTLRSARQEPRPPKDTCDDE